MFKASRATGLAALIALFVLAGGAAIQASDEQKKAETEAICKKAEERYKDLFGKPSREEPHVVILMYKYTFCPPDLEIKQGTKVRWVNVDKRTSHSVWFKQDGKAESDRLFSEEHVETTIELAPGVHAYICGPHAEKRDMRGKITVVP